MKGRPAASASAQGRRPAGSAGTGGREKWAGMGLADFFSDMDKMTRIFFFMESRLKILFVHGK